MLHQRFLDKVGAGLCNSTTNPVAPGSDPLNLISCIIFEVDRWAWENELASDYDAGRNKRLTHLRSPGYGQATDAIAGENPQLLEDVTSLKSPARRWMEEEDGYQRNVKRIKKYFVMAKNFIKRLITMWKNNKQNNRLLENKRGQSQYGKKTENDTELVRTHNKPV